MNESERPFESLPEKLDRLEEERKTITSSLPKSPFVRELSNLLKEYKATLNAVRERVEQAPVPISIFEEKGGEWHRLDVNKEHMAQAGQTTKSIFIQEYLHAWPGSARELLKEKLEEARKNGFSTFYTYTTSGGQEIPAIAAFVPSSDSKQFFYMYAFKLDRILDKHVKPGLRYKILQPWFISRTLANRRAKRAFLRALHHANPALADHSLGVMATFGGFLRFITEQLKSSEALRKQMLSEGITPENYSENFPATFNAILFHKIGLIGMRGLQLLPNHELSEHPVGKNYPEISRRILEHSFGGPESTNIDAIYTPPSDPEKKEDAVSYLTPYSEKGKDIPLLSRMLAITTGFIELIDAGKSKKDALAELEARKGTLYDPDLVDLFVKNFDSISAHALDVVNEELSHVKREERALMPPFYKPSLVRLLQQIRSMSRASRK